MKFTLALLVGAVAAWDCKPQGACNAGFMDITGGKGNWWKCGEKCTGGRKLWTDGSCNCACQPHNGKCNADGTAKLDCAKFKRGQCHAGYYDKTNGGGNWWKCGEKCTGGRRLYTDGSCNCACQPVPKGC